METPSSNRRVTRSQAIASSNSSNTFLLSRKQQQDRSALTDITNDSPIVGLAMGNLETPSSKRVSSQAKFMRTPGSGEDLLRGQVKTLLQKVEEEAEVSKITLENGPLFNLQGLINYSPGSFVGPTPANTPQICDGLPSAVVTPPSLVYEEEVLIPQMINQMLEGRKDCEDVVITRSLLFDFSEKSETSDLSGDSKEKMGTDDDDASIWSIQVNVSSMIDDDEEEEECEDDHFFEEDESCFGGESEDVVDELCEGMSKISVREMPKFAGKHIRFLYNSDDDEIEGEEVWSSDAVLRLKGLPTPKGKHLRFPEESQDN